MNNYIMDNTMRTETVEEYLKRGGKIIKLEKELNTINGAYKTYDATSPATKEGKWGIYASSPTKLN